MRTLIHIHLFLGLAPIPPQPVRYSTPGFSAGTDAFRINLRPLLLLILRFGQKSASYLAHIPKSGVLDLRSHSMAPGCKTLSNDSQSPVCDCHHRAPRDRTSLRWFSNHESRENSARGLS
ncbi:hypothetical protein DFP72DRAFT_161895 [Ephemerocybe angulata]|uniref:Uncharacterized protein n=1 Tax=Ephemerocybe angulata TaxID=980116 RepID=A0A8H6I7L3_9AGAR|nr:hypothetical protein DFP72DRAFT_161895 [Tulosesus angulatus]